MDRKKIKDKREGSKYYFLIVIFLFPLLSLAEELIIVKVDKEVVNTGEIFTYTAEVKGEFTSPEVFPPEFKNFTVVFQNQSRNYSFKDDKIILEFSLTYQLFASQPGEFTIEELIVKDGKKEFKGRSFIIKVEGKPLEEKRKVLPYIDSGIDI